MPEQKRDSESFDAIINTVRDYIKRTKR